MLLKNIPIDILNFLNLVYIVLFDVEAALENALKTAEQQELQFFSPTQKHGGRQIRKFG